MSERQCPLQIGVLEGAVHTPDLSWPGANLGGDIAPDPCGLADLRDDLARGLWTQAEQFSD